MRKISRVLRSVNTETHNIVLIVFFTVIGSILRNYVGSRLPSSEEISSRASERKNSSLFTHTDTRMYLEREALKGCLLLKFFQRYFVAFFHWYFFTFQNKNWW